MLSDISTFSLYTQTCSSSMVLWLVCSAHTVRAQVQIPDRLVKTICDHLPKSCAPCSPNRELVQEKNETQQEWEPCKPALLYLPSSCNLQDRYASTTQSPYLLLSDLFLNSLIDFA